MSKFDERPNLFMGTDNKISVTRDDICVPVRVKFGSSCTLSRRELLLNRDLPPEVVKKQARCKLLKEMNHKIAEWLDDSSFSELTDFVYSVAKQFKEETTWDDNYVISLMAEVRVTEVQSQPVDPRDNYFRVARYRRYK